MMKRVKLIVIGAGPSGLTAAKYAIQGGIGDLLVLERKGGVGGLWNIDEGYTWGNMTTNVSKYTCAFMDFPWPNHEQMFPKGSSLAKYMKDYADHFRVTEHIRFKCNVTSVKQKEDGSFIVSWQQKEGEATRMESVEAEHLIIGSGMFETPNMNVAVPGLATFQGSITHSSAYRKPDEFSGKKILVIGGSISGVEISADMSQSTEQVIHQFHKPFFVISHFLPLPVIEGGEEVLKNIPSDFTGYTRSYLEMQPNVPYHEIVRRKNRGMAQFCQEQGKMDQIGFTEADFGRVMYVTLSSNYLSSVQQQKVIPKKAKIKHFTERSVIFQDDSEYAIDGIVLATGYQNSLPFLSAALKEAIEYDATDNRQTGLLYNYIISPKIPNLYFVGHYKGIIVPACEIQAKYAVSVILGHVVLPSCEEMEKQVQKQQKYFHDQPDPPQSLNHNYVPYADTLMRLMKAPLDFTSLKQQDPHFYSEFIQLPSIQTERAFNSQFFKEEAEKIRKIIKEECTVAHRS